MLIHRFPSELLGLIALWLTAALGCESSTRVATLSDEPLIRDDGRLISLDSSLEPLIERFNGIATSRGWWRLFQRRAALASRAQLPSMSRW